MTTEVRPQTVGSVLVAMTSRSPLTRFIAAALAVSLVAVACSDDDGAPTTEIAPTVTLAPETSRGFLDDIGNAFNSAANAVSNTANDVGTTATSIVNDVGGFFEGLGNTVENEVNQLVPLNDDQLRADAERRLDELTEVVAAVHRALSPFAGEGRGGGHPSTAQLLDALNSVPGFQPSRGTAAAWNVGYESITFQFAGTAAMAIGAEIDLGSGWNLPNFRAGGTRDCEVLGGALTVGVQGGLSGGLAVGFWRAPASGLAGDSIVFSAGAMYVAGATAAIFYAPQLKEYQGFVIVVGTGAKGSAVNGGQAITRVTCPPPG